MPELRDKVTFEDVLVIEETPLAIRCHIDGDRKSGLFWIPQSQVDDDSEIWRTGDRGTLVISGPNG